MSDRKYSDPMIYDNSIDSDDDPSGHDGGYDRHGNYINSAAMMELVGLRKELAALRESVSLHKKCILRSIGESITPTQEDLDLWVALQEKGE